MEFSKPEIKMVQAKDLIPNPNNPKRHPASQINELAESMKEFGYTDLIIVDKKMNILAGHGRYMAILKLGVEKFAVNVCPIDDPLQQKAYILAANKLAENSSWIDELRNAFLVELQDSDYDVSVTGFSFDDLNNIFEKDPGMTEPPKPTVGTGGEVTGQQGYDDAAGASDSKQLFFLFDNADYADVTQKLIDVMNEQNLGTMNDALKYICGLLNSTEEE